MDVEGLIFPIQIFVNTLYHEFTSSNAFNLYFSTGILCHIPQDLGTGNTELTYKKETSRKA